MNKDKPDCHQKNNMQKHLALLCLGGSKVISNKAKSVFSGNKDMSDISGAWEGMCAPHMIKHSNPELSLGYSFSIVIIRTLSGEASACIHPG